MNIVELNSSMVLGRSELPKPQTHTSSLYPWAAWEPEVEALELDSSDSIYEVWGLIHGSHYCLKDAVFSLVKSKVSALLHLRCPALHFQI